MSEKVSRRDNLKSENLIDRLNGIIMCYDDRNVSDEELALLYGLMKDNRVIGGRRLSSYAVAALYLLGIKSLKLDEDAKFLVNELS